MPYVSAHFLAGLRPTGTRVRLFAAAFCGTAVVASAGCSSGSAKASGHTANSPATASSSGSADSTGGSLACRALYLALVQGKRDTSALGNINVRVSGASASTSAGTMRMQFKPSTVISSAVQIKASSRVVNMDEITAGNTLYIKTASLTVATGKPWAAVPSPVAAASAGQPDMSNPNPLQDMVLLFNSGDCHGAGTQVVNGISTTRYEGSYPASDALKGLKPREIKTIGSSIHGLIDETVWVDGQHQLRRVVTTEHVSALTITITINITAVNVPLSVAVPPANQVSHLPLSALGGN
ncbi:MAG TPA: hypothetical protein VGS19_15180 [Streptosporangiaceae bacterium]|nr:hypothetical protein [Streptosporangiaceae bacterium]